MARNTVYNKTGKGLTEVKNRSGRLSMAQRRVLILADGKRTAETIMRFSRVAEYEQLLVQLALDGYLVVAGERQRQPSTSSSTPPPSPEVLTDFDDARKFMLNTLQAFTSPVRNARLMQEVSATSSKEELKMLLKRWYDAIAENPDSVQRVDELRAKLLEKLV
jgi:hypothetical protein